MAVFSAAVSLPGFRSHHEVSNNSISDEMAEKGEKSPETKTASGIIPQRGDSLKSKTREEKNRKRLKSAHFYQFISRQTPHLSCEP